MLGRVSSFGTTVERVSYSGTTAERVIYSGTIVDRLGSSGTTVGRVSSSDAVIDRIILPRQSETFRPKKMLLLCPSPMDHSTHQGGTKKSMVTCTS